MIYDCIEGLDAVSFFKGWETSGEGTESGSTATAIFLRNDVLFISHVGDSCVVYNYSSGFKFH